MYFFGKVCHFPIAMHIWQQFANMGTWNVYTAVMAPPSFVALSLSLFFTRSLSLSLDSFFVILPNYILCDCKNYKTNE